MPLNEYWNIFLEIQPCSAAGPDKEEDVNEDICGGDDDDDEGTDANVVRNTLQQALVVLMLRIILRKQFSETDKCNFQNQINALSARFEKWGGWTW